MQTSQNVSINHKSAPENPKVLLAESLLIIAKKLTSHCQFQMTTVTGSYKAFFTMEVNGEKL